MFDPGLSLTRVAVKFNHEDTFGREFSDRLSRMIQAALEREYGATARFAKVEMVKTAGQTKTLYEYRISAR